MEKLFFGTVDDMPFPLVVFAGVLEGTTVLSEMDPLEFKERIANVIRSGREWAGRPARTARGEVAWKKISVACGDYLVGGDLMRSSSFFC